MSFIHNTDSIHTSGIQQKSTVSQSRSMARVPFTGRRSKALRNTSGLKRELQSSKSFHAEGLPLLVSSLLLRERLMGQIDLARLQKDKEGWVIEVAEVKSSDLGAQAIIRGQRSRIFHAIKFLSGIFGHRSKFILLSGEESL